MDATATALAALVIGLTSLVLYNRRGTNHSVVKEVEGEKVNRAAIHPEDLLKCPNNVTTAYESFVEAAEKYGNNRCSGTRKKQGKDSWGDYEWKTYKEIKKKADDFGSGIINLGAKSGDRIGIFSKNREEWMVAQQACFSQSLVIVSFYETLGKDSLRYVADHADIGIALCNGESLSKLYEVVDGKEGYKGIKYIIVMDEFSEEERKKGESLGLKLKLFSEVEKDGANKPVKANPPSSEDLATIMYTSGTTGSPKGVLITHGVLMAEIAGIMRIYPVPKDVGYLSFLPLAHILERVILLTCLHNGGHIGFFHGDVQGVPEDVKILKPNVFVGVPRIYERTKDAVLKQVEKQGILTRIVFRLAFFIKKFSILHARWLPIGFLDTLVFNKTKEALGGKIQLMISAGAPLSLKTEIFLRVCFGNPVSQAYGLTETCGASHVKLPSDPTVGHLGGPLPCNEFKLEDLKDMGYTKNDKPNPRGELWIRGNNIAKGYFKDEEKTKESFVEGGWFLTGDIAEIDSNGSMRIIDRKKNMFKLAQGEYVAVEQVEDKLMKQCDEIEQLCVYGDSHETTLVAIVVPKDGTKGGEDGGGKEAREKFKKILADAGKRAGLQGFEIPRNTWIAKEGFTQENDLLTPTMKLKRNVIKDKYKKEIAQMYKESGNR